MSFIQELKDQKHYYEMLENTKNKKEIDEAIEKIDSLLLSKTEGARKRIWNYLYEQYKQIPLLESLDNQHFYELMAYKKQQLETKLQGKKP